MPDAENMTIRGERLDRREDEYPRYRQRSRSSQDQNYLHINQETFQAPLIQGAVSL
jgi:hypothetical protein